MRSVSIWRKEAISNSDQNSDHVFEICKSSGCDNLAFTIRIPEDYGTSGSCMDYINLIPEASEMRSIMLGCILSKLLRCSQIVGFRTPFRFLF